MELSKKCLVCGDVFNNKRKDNSSTIGFKQFNNRIFCSLKCRGTNDSIIKNTNEYKIINSSITHLIVKGSIFIIDTDDILKLKDYVWCHSSGGYLNNIKNNKSILLHRLIMNCPKDKIIDHKNRDVKDNRKQNLRITDYSMNGYNKTCVLNTSGTVGVSYSNRDNNWRAEISYKKLNIKINKCFKNKNDAIKARKEMEKNLENLIY